MLLIQPTEHLASVKLQLFAHSSYQCPITMSHSFIQCQFHTSVINEYDGSLVTSDHKTMFIVRSRKVKHILL